MMPLRRTIFFLALTCTTFACGSGKNGSVEEGKIRPVAYSEGDTLELDPYPPNLSLWLAFHGKKLPGFLNGTFRASGVVLHIDSLKTVPDPTKHVGINSLLSWNPDSSMYINIFGNGWTIYPPMNALHENTGDIDQEVVLGRSGAREQRSVMLCGPGETVETADWLGKDVFILSRTTTDVRKNSWAPEIYLFSLKDSTFTNFIWTRTVPIDSLTGRGDDFINNWLLDHINKKP